MLAEKSSHQRGLPRALSEPTSGGTLRHNTERRNLRTIVERGSEAVLICPYPNVDRLSGGQ
jgi:hypothetical protein